MRHRIRIAFVLAVSVACASVAHAQVFSNKKTVRMDEATVGKTYAAFAPGVEWALERAREAAGQGTLDALVLPDAGDVVPRLAR